MRKLLVSVGVAAAVALAAATAAFAHVPTLTVAATCQEETGTWSLAWTLTTTNNDTNPKVIESDNTAIPVGSSPGVFTQTLGGNTNASLTTNVKVRWTDNFTATAKATADLSRGCTKPTPPPTPTCPAGLTFVSFDGKILVCKKTETVTNTVTNTVTVQVPVDKIVTVEKLVPVPGPTVVKIKKVPGPIRWRNHTRVRTVIVYRYVPCKANQNYDTKTRTCVPKIPTG
jgi:hypothetical protein